MDRFVYFVKFQFTCWLDCDKSIIYWGVGVRASPPA